MVGGRNVCDTSKVSECHMEKGQNLHSNPAKNISECHYASLVLFLYNILKLLLYHTPFYH